MFPTKALDTYFHDDNNTQDNSKDVSIRMASIILDVVLPHQHKFLKGRSIYDNILVVMVNMEYAQFKK